LPTAGLPPHPSLRVLPDPGFYLLLHFGRDPAHIVGLAGRARNFEFLELDAKAALGAEPQTARHPNAGAHAARDHGRDGHRLGRSSEEWHGDAGAVVQVTDEPQASALPPQVHDHPPTPFASIPPPP